MQTSMLLFECLHRRRCFLVLYVRYYANFKILLKYTKIPNDQMDFKYFGVSPFSKQENFCFYSIKKKYINRNGQ